MVWNFGIIYWLVGGFVLVVVSGWQVELTALRNFLTVVDK